MASTPGGQGESTLHTVSGNPSELCWALKLVGTLGRQEMLVLVHTMPCRLLGSTGRQSMGLFWQSRFRNWPGRAGSPVIMFVWQFSRSRVSGRAGRTLS